MKSQLSQSPSRFPSTLIIKQQFEHQTQHMQKQNFETFHLPKCQTHLLPQQFSCIQPSCEFNSKLSCSDCIMCFHQRLSINKVVPMMKEWISQQNQNITRQNKRLFQEWNVVKQNLTYCIEIFQQLLNIIDSHLQKRLYAPQKFIDIVANVFGMFTKDPQNESPEMILKNWNHLLKKYNLFDQGEKQNTLNKDKLNDQNLLSWNQINCQKLQHQKKHRLNQVNHTSKKSKAFSQKALAFSEQLASLISSKVKEQQIKTKIKSIKTKNQICLNDLMTKFSSLNQLKTQQQTSELTQMLESVDTFSVQLSGKDSLKSIQQLQSHISRLKNLKNLKQLRINNKNGKIQHKLWYHIINYLELLKFLKDLKLVLTLKDLQPLSQLFRQKQKAVRQIESLALQITDQKNLQLKDVNDFLNTMQLRRLNLNLSRNGLQFKEAQEFLKKLKVYTSMSQLPLIQCKITFTANKFYKDQKLQLQKIFNETCKDVKIKQLIL